MYPHVNSPALAASLAAMMSDEAIAEAKRRRDVELAREARHAAHREAVRRSRPQRPTLQLAVAAGAVASIAFGSAWVAMTATADHSAPAPHYTSVSVVGAP